MATMSAEYFREYYSRNKARISARQKAWFQENLERERAKRSAYLRERRATDPAFRERQYANAKASKARRSAADPKNVWITSVVKAARQRAARRGLEFTLTLALVELPDNCPALGIRLDYSLGRGKKSFLDESPSLDRIDSKKGYIDGNVRVISWRANAIKRDATSEELEAIAAYIRKVSQ